MTVKMAGVFESAFTHIAKTTILYPLYTEMWFKNKKVKTVMRAESDCFWTEVWLADWIKKKS